MFACFLALTPLLCQRDTPTTTQICTRAPFPSGINPETGSRRPDGSHCLVNKGWRTHVYLCCRGFSVTSTTLASAVGIHLCVMRPQKKKSTNCLSESFVVTLEPSVEHHSVCLFASILFPHHFALEQKGDRVAGI